MSAKLIRCPGEFHVGGSEEGITGECAWCGRRLVLTVHGVPVEHHVWVTIHGAYEPPGNEPDAHDEDCLLVDDHDGKCIIPERTRR